MTKERQSTKEAKKEPIMNLKEKRAAKKAKKEDTSGFTKISTGSTG